MNFFFFFGGGISVFCDPFISSLEHSRTFRAVHVGCCCHNMTVSIWVVVVVLLLFSQYGCRSYSDYVRAGPSGVRISEGERDFSLTQNVQPCSGAHPAVYSACMGLFSRWLSGRDVMFSAEVLNEWSCTSIFPCGSKAPTGAT